MNIHNKNAEFKQHNLEIPEQLYTKNWNDKL